MRVVVVGAGIAGAVTALALSREGHEVHILEGAAEVARGASHANAGLISPGHCFSWAEPGVMRMAVKAAIGLGDGIGICQPWRPSLIRWGLQFNRQSTHLRWLANSRAALALSAYSRDVQFGADPISLDAYDGKHTGILYLYGANDAPGDHDAQLLSDAGEAFESLDSDRLLTREPALQLATIRFDKATYSPNDGTGDAARYAAAALTKAMTLGAQLHLSEPVHSFEQSGTRITAVRSNRNRYETDAVVIATGLASRELLAGIGYDLPIQAVTGYSASYEGDFSCLPRVGAVSIPHKIAWTAFGENRVRFTGFADIGMPGHARSAKRFDALTRFAASVLPEVRKFEPYLWIGQRPMTPDNLPFLGQGRHANLWLNCGHGAMGWTMSSGCAQILADLIGKRTPKIDLAPYRCDRFHSMQTGDQPHQE
ncbi:FAD-dependent oxidoreductase [Paraburkholderia susongensis]|uniref:D-amino-acid dehydrogenase n=1 Tax=Paraburkholderia susongensis TaxID=1515439 RepID=A0A1X7LN23_9BURK|nr:FAD-dependent oxidoreductase [Paraburkholderia susongensis]SMG54914.1 D-amino-acid dehydrogenase [Paraburkholderia susongensis]